MKIFIKLHKTGKVCHSLGELGTIPMIHFPKEMVSRSEKFGTAFYAKFQTLIDI